MKLRFKVRERQSALAEREGETRVEKSRYEGREEARSLGAETGDQGKVRMEGRWALQGPEGHRRTFCLCASNYRKHRDGSNLGSDWCGGEIAKGQHGAGSPDRRPLPWSVGSVGKEACRWPHGT